VARSVHQKRLRQRRNERAFIFDKDLERCLGAADREDWELAISLFGGNVADAATDCGLEGIPKNAKVLWGKSAEEALSTYRRWQRKKRR
jgi:hypothetical protein